MSELIEQLIHLRAGRDEWKARALAAERQRDGNYDTIKETEAKLEAAKRERDEWERVAKAHQAEFSAAEDILAAVRKYALDTEDDYVLAILDGEGGAVRHGELHGSMTAFMLLDQLAPCECGHPQQDHDEDDRCTRCECDLFRDGEGKK